MANLTKKQIEKALSYNKKRGYSKDQVKDVQKAVAASPVDGLWGPLTVRAVATWQEAKGLVADGKVGPKTMRMLSPPEEVSESVILTPSAYPILHPLPKISSKWGYDHCPWEYLKPCPTWTATTGNGSFEAGLLRLVSGHRRSKGRDIYSRAPDSWISLDELSIGFAHWWADTAPDIFEAIADDLPKLAAHAWGPELAESMTGQKWIRGQIRVKRGKRPHQTKYDWLLAGWWEIGLHPEVIRLCAEDWFEDYTPHGLARMKTEDWKKGTTLAGLIRMTNSRGAGGMKSLVRKAKKIAKSDDEDEVLETAFCHHELYDHPNRWERILDMKEFEGAAPKRMRTGNLQKIEGPVARVDGSTPAWVALGL
jgi:hypothetical protein